jgi:hypothetical protein
VCDKDHDFEIGSENRVLSSLLPADNLILLSI